VKHLLRILIAALTIIIGVQLYQILTQEPLYATAWGEEDPIDIYNQLTPNELYIVIEGIEQAWTILYTEFLFQLIASDFEEPESNDTLNQLKTGMHELEILSEELYKLMLSKMNESEPQKEPELLTPKYNI